MGTQKTENKDHTCGGLWSHIEIGFRGVKPVRFDRPDNEEDMESLETLVVAIMTSLTPVFVAYIPEDEGQDVHLLTNTPEINPKEFFYPTKES